MSYKLHRELVGGKTVRLLLGVPELNARVAMCCLGSGQP